MDPEWPSRCNVSHVQKEAATTYPTTPIVGRRRPNIGRVAQIPAFVGRFDTLSPEIAAKVAELGLTFTDCGQLCRNFRQAWGDIECALQMHRGRVRTLSVEQKLRPRGATR